MAILLPPLRALVRTAQRKKRERFGPIPRRMRELTEVPYHLTRTTFRDKPFMFFFYEFEFRDANGCRRRTKVLAFATRKNLRRLFRSIRIFIDGTFKIVPYPFGRYRGGQLLTISSLYGDKNQERLYPRIYILIGSKRQDLYESVIENVLLRGARWLGVARRDLPTVVKWEMFTTDFEPALRNAIQRVCFALLLRWLRALGCHFHFVKVT